MALVALAAVSVAGLTGFGLIALGIPGVLALMLASLAAPRATGGLDSEPPAETWLGSHVLALAVLGAVGFWLVLFLGMGWRKEVSYRVRWEAGPPGPQYPGEEEVTVRFADYPGYEVLFHSRELTACLA
jgi:hypothetical protein